MIEVVGIGLDGAAGLTETVRQIVEKSTLLVGSDRHLSYFPNHPAQRLLKLPSFELGEHLPENIVILASGDPLFFGLGRLLLEKFPPHQLRFHPHLSSVQLAFNRLKVPWQDAQIVSVHGRSLEPLTQLLQQGVQKIAVLTDSTNHPGAIARLYRSLDLPTRYDFWVCENLGAASEHLRHFGDTDELASMPESAFAPLNVVILLQSQAEVLPDINTLPVLGLPDHVFLSWSDRPGLMTKREVRLVVLGELALQPGIVWDIGAGTGSVSIEIARLCPASSVYAIEKTTMGVTLIEQNCQRLQVNNVTAVGGTAPDVLSGLPAPNRIFIGGSGGNLLSILEACEQKLTADGVIVLAVATLEHLNLCLEWLKARWHYRLVQLQISRSVPVGNLTRFTPLNPVTIITATR